MAPKRTAFTLPHAIVTPTELNRLIREAEAVNEALHQASIRKGGEETKLPKLSRLLNELVEANSLNLLHEADRMQLTAIFDHLSKQSPQLHISFSVDPSAAFTQKLIVWLRQEIHPYILLRIGLQPNIGAGCVVRTPSKVLDLSLREHFAKSRNILLEKLRALPPAEVTHE